MTDKINEIQNRVNASREDIIQFMLEICEIPSMDSQIGPVGERVQAEMKKLGFDEVRFDKMGNTVGRIGNGRKKIVYDSHIDTVGVGDPHEWKWDPFKGKIENGLHPKIRVEVAGKISSKKFLALVDTGFDLEIALHHQEAARLGLKIKNYIWIDYADGARLKEPISPARVIWHGKWKEIKVVLSNDEEPAVGTQLLQGSVVTMDFIKNRLAIAEPRRKR